MYTHEQVEQKLGEKIEYEYEEDTEKEDLTEKFKYIESLPTELIRGFKFPTDERGYFICWPDRSFYKYRLYNPGKGSKYLGPKGHKPPLFWSRREGRPILAIVEGEINSLSVAKAVPEWDVCSPGSASMFNVDNLSKHLTEFTKYANLVVVLDDDPAGIKGLIEAQAFFLYKHPFVNYIKIKPDPNEVLLVEGSAALREKVQGAYNQQIQRFLL
jgi:hypothetical protein